MGYRAALREYVELQALEGGSGRLVLNAVTAPGGHIRVELTDRRGEPLAGYRFEDCDGVGGDHLEAVVRWRGRGELPEMEAGGELIARVELVGATLYAFDFATA